MLRNTGLFAWRWVLEHKVPFLTVALIVAASLDTTLFFRLIKQMPGKTFLLSQLVFPVAFAGAIWTLSLLAYRDRICCLGGWRAVRAGTDEADPGLGEGAGHRFSIRQHWRVLLTLASIDAAGGVVAILPVLYLPSIVLLLMGQINLPLNMTLSRIVLKHIYRLPHVLGSLVVIVSVLTATYADVETPGDAGTRSGLHVDELVFWALLLFALKLFDGYMTIYREKQLKALNLPPWHLVAWVALFQLPMALVALPVAMLPFPSPYVPIAPANFFAYVGTAVDALAEGDNALVFGLFLLFNITANVISPTLVQLESSNFTAVTTILRLGLTAFFLSQPWLAGGAYHSVHFLHGLGFVGMVLGIAVYFTGPAVEKPPQPAPAKLSSDMELEQYM